MLQGPMGSFFNQVAAWLTLHGTTVRKINFNGGDWLFHRHLNAINYWGTLAAFPTFLNRCISSYQIDGIVCFGDCRHYHRAAAKVAEMAGIPFFVFEEGYVRPYYMTLDLGGVNMYSSLPKSAEFYRALPNLPVDEPQPTRASFLKQAISAMAYYAAGRLLRHRYPSYVHHKNFSVGEECKIWLRSWLRKQCNRWRDCQVYKGLIKQQDAQYFAAILQVHTDSQVHHHSDYGDVRDFIEEVIASFSANARDAHHLVFKHHPMDRGCRDYRLLVESLSALHEVSGRVHYVHDVHLPTLLRRSCGVVTINSTVGMSALYHGKPLMAMGRSLYNLPGLTFDGTLDRFWRSQYRIDEALWQRFRAFLITRTQLNASFYGRDFLDAMSELSAQEEGEIQTPPHPFKTDREMLVSA